ncbi:MAG TPA: SAM-dependent chlorinase/fluorinase, partial [Frankiaceae bacterium]|nr:SAM-dependent chlorinase/fluorinase [Frankiaceae bacterium]
MGSFACLSFLTDYGLEDGFVAACHGVIAARAPDVRIIDVTHLVPPGDVRRGAVVLAQVVPYLPPAVHLAVVDPGVGTPRRAVVVTTGRGVLVGPDNGLLLDAAGALGGPRAAYRIRGPDPVSRTFHGRDVFAPAAAALARGVEPAALGPPVDPAGLVRLPPPVRRLVADTVEAEVLLVDRFGNVQLAADPALLARLGLTPGARLRLAVGAAAHDLPYRGTFGDVGVGELVAYVDSAGL